MNKKRALVNLTMENKKPRILVIGTGGAISVQIVNGKWQPGEIPQQKLIDNIARIKENFEIKTTNLFRMDSGDMLPHHWLTLANTIYYQMKDYDGIVVTIGTDTMHYADTAIAFLIQNNNIPIVFTGSQAPSTQLNTDALWNLKNAITVAGKSDIAETLVVFNNLILRATRTKRINASEFRAFYTNVEKPLGTVEQFIKIDSEHKKRGKRIPKLYKKLETKVKIIKIYPGFDDTEIITAVDKGTKGIILEGYNLGNVPLLENTLKKSIEYANKNNVPIILTGDCNPGRYWSKIYSPNIGKRLTGLKLIPAYDMLTETAYVKLMWVLGQTQKYPEVKKMMQKNYVGEITPFNKKDNGIQVV